MSDSIGDLEVQVVASFRGLMTSIERRLQEINRSQAIKLRVKLQERTLAGLNKQLKSYSGFNALSNQWNNASEKIQGFLNNIGAVGRRLTYLGGIIGPVTVGIGGLAASFSTLGTAAVGGLAAIPGVFGGLAVSMFVFKQAMKGAKTEIPGIYTQFANLKKLVGTDFWKGARDGLNNFMKESFGPLEKGLGSLATSMGKFAGSLADAFTKAFTPKVYSQFFGGISSFFDILGKKAAGPLADLLAKLLTFGSSLLPQIANGLSNIIVKVDSFLKRNPTFLINAWGTFKSVLKGLFGLVAGLVGVIQSLGSAATKAGVGTLGLGGGLKSISDIMKGPAFQNGLTAFFRDALAGSKGLGAALGPLGKLFASLSPIIGSFVKESGQVLGGFFATLFKDINQPGVLKNISSALSNFPKIFKNMEPALGPLVSKFSELLKFGGALADEFSKNLATVIQVLAPIFTALLPPIEKLMHTLAALFRTRIKDMAPQFKSVGKALGGLVDAASDFVKALNTPVLKFIMGLITDFIFTALKGVINVVAGILKVVSGFAKILSGDWSGFADIWKGIKKLIVGAFQLFITIFAPAKFASRFIKIGTKLGPVVGKLVIKLVSLFAKGLDAIPGLGVRMMEMLLKKLTKAAPEIGNAVIHGLMRGIQALIGGALADFFNWLVGGIKSLLGISSPSKVFDQIGRFLIQGLMNGIKALINGVVKLFTAPIDTIKAAFKVAFDVIVSVAKLAWTGIKLDFLVLKTVITTEIKIVQAVVKGVWEAIKVAAELLWRAVKAYFETWKSAITLGIRVVKDIVTGVWDVIRSAGGAVWDRIRSVFNGMKDGISGGIRVLRDIVNGVWSGIRSVGENIWSAISGAFSRMKGGLEAGVRGIKSVFTGVWDAIKGAFKGTINSIIGAWNGFVSHLKIPPIKIPFAPDFPGLDIGSHLQIPYLASGIRDFLGGLAIVGERGPELVRLPPGSDVFSNREFRNMLRHDDQPPSAQGQPRPPLELKVVNYYPQAEPTSVTTNKALQRAALLGVV